MELKGSCNNLSKTHNIFLETDNTATLYSKLKYSSLLTEYVTQNSEEETGLKLKWIEKQNSKFISKLYHNT
jgi:hypothetical protein